ncbi:DUF1990 family protein [Hoyosella subflava]|uniref:DUF1990 domain-containing protein n=1 Tax=Hoyosella subflava (strain DSM 45089 / JCM 17490 / NBRC 109087 / DQS3-9A1) TaxID=443218 RepID=F6ENQ0_HOYSD|nr:DUF1990 domain-containing protein [Hoyosella subflava]AEF42907.1 hypothetical protein AS9A_4475 [Hoyosella subflava DQS3-9A1]
MDLEAYRHLELTYPEVGATAKQLPSGYRNMLVSRRIGTGRECFERAAERVSAWGMQRGVGLSVRASSPTAQQHTIVEMRMLWMRIPCRVVYVVREENCSGFAYGTLPGHPVSGEELFLVRIDQQSGAVFASVTAFSRPASAFVKLLGPLAGLGQKLAARMYVRTLVG